MNPPFLAAALYIGLALYDLPHIWRSAKQRRTFWVVLGLYVIGLVFGVVVASNLKPIHPWRLIEAIFRPIGEPFLRPAKG